MDIQKTMMEKAQAAKVASHKMAILSSSVKNDALQGVETGTLVNKVEVFQSVAVAGLFFIAHAGFNVVEVDFCQCGGGDALHVFGTSVHCHRKITSIF